MDPPYFDFLNLDLHPMHPYSILHVIGLGANTNIIVTWDTGSQFTATMSETLAEELGLQLSEMPHPISVGGVFDRPSDIHLETSIELSDGKIHFSLENVLVNDLFGNKLNIGMGGMYALGIIIDFLSMRIRFRDSGASFPMYLFPRFADDMEGAAYVRSHPETQTAPLALWASFTIRGLLDE